MHLAANRNDEIGDDSRPQPLPSFCWRRIGHSKSNGTMTHYFIVGGQMLKNKALQDIVWQQLL